MLTLATIKFINIYLLNADFEQKNSFGKLGRTKKQMDIDLGAFVSITCVLPLIIVFLIWADRG